MGQNSEQEQLNKTIWSSDDVLPELAYLNKQGETDEDALTRLTNIIGVLRGEDGCPWDKVQTHTSLRTCLIEEAYEACDAIDRLDMDNLEEELGDVLLQIVFHGELGKSSGDFDFKSIANRVSDKMIRRHPHIFFRENAKSVDKVIEKWENVKRRERGTVSQTKILESVPMALPALTRSYKIQAKAAEVGFDWDRVDEAFGKVDEELAELRDALRNAGGQEIKEELGDLLFSVVNVARFLKINPEDALNATSQKFVRRFAFIEEQASKLSKKLDEMNLEEMDELWEQAKRDMHG